MPFITSSYLCPHPVLCLTDVNGLELHFSETVEWIGIWGKHMKSIMFRAIKDGQKMNHFPGTFQIGRKDRLWRNLQKLATKFGNKEFGIMPKTYVLPHDMKLLKHDWEKSTADDERWIIKPVGIVLFKQTHNHGL